MDWLNYKVQFGANIKLGLFTYNDHASFYENISLSHWHTLYPNKQKLLHVVLLHFRYCFAFCLNKILLHVSATEVLSVKIMKFAILRTHLGKWLKLGIFGLNVQFYNY